MRFHVPDRKIDVSLSWRHTEIMRGVSIVLIMLHNLFHLYPTVCHECEFTYSPGLTKLFFEKMQNPDGYIFYHIISFLGWFGVPVFIFLSGYGLTRRYDSVESGSQSNRNTFDKWSFIRRNWIKLFQLMLLGVGIFLLDQIINDLLSGGGIRWKNVAGILIPLTELNDTVQLWLATIPGVYWYFGLAFEFYIFYAFCVHGRRQLWMWIFAVVCFGAFLLLRKYPPISAEPLGFEEYMRHNFIGWMLPFACGVWLGRLRRMNLWVAISIVIASILLFIPLQGSVYTWQLSAVCAIIIIMAIALLFVRIPYWGDLWGWIGRLSAYLFVAHPIVRHLSRFLTFANPYRHPVLPSLDQTFLYITLAFLGALLYRYINRFLFFSKR